MQYAYSADDQLRAGRVLAAGAAAEWAGWTESPRCAVLLTRTRQCDLTASGLTPFAPEVAAIKAGRIMLGEIDDHVAHRRSFALETTLSGRAYAAKLLHWRSLGYHVSLYFLELATAAMAIERVQLRVTQGGHNIPDDVVRRRFDAGLTQFEKTYKPIVNAWFLYNNQHRLPILLAKGVNP